MRGGDRPVKTIIPRVKKTAPEKGSLAVRLVLLLTASGLFFPPAAPVQAAGPSETLIMSVHIGASGGGIPDGPARFRVLPQGVEYVAVERALIDSATRILTNRGYVRDETRPEITLAVSYECLPVRVETAAGPGGDPMDERLYIKGSFSETRFSRKIGILVFTAMAGDAPAWRGEVTSEGSCGETVRDAPTLVEELLGEFPRTTGRPTQRTRLREGGR